MKKAKVKVQVETGRSPLKIDLIFALTSTLALTCLAIPQPQPEPVPWSPQRLFHAASPHKSRSFYHPFPTPPMETAIRQLGIPQSCPIMRDTEGCMRGPGGGSAGGTLHQHCRSPWISEVLGGRRRGLGGRGTPRLDRRGFLRRRVTTIVPRHCPESDVG